MRPRLLHKDHDFDADHAKLWNEDALTQDLGLDTLFGTMSGGDEFLLDITKRVVFSSLENDPDAIRYRQAVLRDCLAQPDVARALYALTVEALAEEKKHWWLVGHREHADWVLHSSIGILEAYLPYLERLRDAARTHTPAFASDGWRALFETLQHELDNEYLEDVRDDLNELKFKRGALASARLGPGNQAREYVLHRIPRPKKRGLRLLTEPVPDAGPVAEWLIRHFGQQPDAYRFSVHPRDEAGSRALGELRERAASDVANALARSVDHVHGFFHALRKELAFYVACLNLHDALAKKGEPVSFPEPAPTTENALSFRGIYDAGLALRTSERVIGNDADADACDLVIITGPNQGGKSTLLRSVGLAQLMMQAGMFAPAQGFRASTRTSLLTHFKREEDKAMESGKLDEELHRMSQIVDHVTPHAMILFNESFAATNEREGSQIAREIVDALLDKRVKIAFVTHQYELAHGYYERRRDGTLFLRAQREDDRTRTYKLTPGEPLRTSFGEDLYDRIFRDAKP